ncbi:complement C1q-like protein 2 [Trachinotus anak]|uniref:complement C1q-like protein 2 n=1 Tax=Trachinotus anak TaxID=443729 RepID=UPI0039F18EB3
MKIAVSFLLLLVCSVSTGQPETTTQDVHAVLREMTASLAQLKVEMASLQNENKAHTAKLRELALLEYAVNRQQVELNKLNQKWLDKHTAFSASLLAEGEGTIGPFDKPFNLIFKNVLNNVGSPYNPNTGYFVTPVTGVYHFEWHISGKASSTGVVLVKNSNHTFTAYQNQTTGYGSSSQSATLLLGPGDIIRLRLLPNTVIYDNENHVSTFSGHIILAA